MRHLGAADVSFVHMDMIRRFKRTNEGFTLVELVIAVTLSAVVLISASGLLINFGKFSADVVKSEASLMGTALGAYEEIVAKIIAANKVAIPPGASMNVPAVAYPAGCSGSSCIQIRMDQKVGLPLAFTPSVFTDDAVYTYWLNVRQLRRTGVAGDPATGTVIAGDVISLSFSKVAENKIKAVLEAETSSGPTSGSAATSEEHLETTAIMRSRSAT